MVFTILSTDAPRDSLVDVKVDIVVPIAYYIDYLLQFTGDKKFISRDEFLLGFEGKKNNKLFVLECENGGTY